MKGAVLVPRVLGARRILPLLAVGAAWAAEGDLRIRPDPLVRPGVVFRCAVAGDAPETVRSVTAVLLDGERVLAVSEVPVAGPAQLAAGIVVALIPSASATAPVLRVRLADGGHRALARSEAPLAAPGAPDLPPAVDAPLPRLWREQIAELRQAEVPSLADHRALLAAVERLRAWPTTAVDGPTRILAFVDPVDGSVQPVRLTLPPGSGQPPLAVIARGLAGATKSSWEPLPASWYAAARAAGVAVLEAYPAGDAAFAGAARRRLPSTEAAARAAVPGLGPSLIIAAHDGLADPAAWAIPQPLPALAPPRGRLAAWADGPFVVVVGTGEHRAARDDARSLMDAFMRAWATHAHGLPPVVDDTAFRERDWPGRNLVLIGSPRGNAVLRDLLPGLPVAWDDRTIRVGGRTCHRSLAPALAVAVAHPLDPSRTILVLDGAPAWSAAPGGPPLAAEARDADLVLRPGPAEGGEPLRLLLESTTARP